MKFTIRHLAEAAKTDLIDARGLVDYLRARGKITYAGSSLTGSDVYAGDPAVIRDDLIHVLAQLDELTRRMVL